MSNTFLTTCFLVQCRVIKALLLREMITRYGRNGLGFLWMFVEPMFFTLCIAVIWSAAGLHSSKQLPIVAFTVTGYSCALLWRKASSRCSGAVDANIGLMFHRNVKVVDLFVTRSLLELAGVTASFFLLTLLFSALGVMDPPADALKLLGGWLLLAWFALSLGFVVGTLSAQLEWFKRIWPVVSLILFMLSGTFFMVEWLPPNAQSFVLWFPMVQGVEMVRHGYFGGGVITHENVGYFAAANLVFSLIAIAMERQLERSVEVR